MENNWDRLSKEALPYEGEFYFARKKKFKELVFFVHFYDGSKRQMLRHIRLVNEIGFDAFAFQLNGNHKDFMRGKLPFAPSGAFGAKQIYKEQIDYFLDLIQGNKIVFAFSNPCASAIESIADRKAKDVTALICDSGPTVHIVKSGISLLATDYHVTNPILKYIAGPIFSLAWSPHLHKDLKKQLDQFPQDFPILSIRGWKDPLMEPQGIDEVFEPHPQLKWQKLSLPEAGHLNGLRDFRAEYVPPLTRFITSVGTVIPQKPGESNG